MPGPIVRFLIEAVFLILVAVGAGLAHLSAPAIVATMLAAWIVVALIERAISADLSRRAAEMRGAEGHAPEPPADLRSHVTVIPASTPAIEPAAVVPEAPPFEAPPPEPVASEPVASEPVASEPVASEPSAAAEKELVSEAEPVSEPVSEPEPLAAPEPVAAAPPPLVEQPSPVEEPPGPPVEPAPEPPRLEAVPGPPSAPPEPVPEPEPAPQVVHLIPQGPRSWNLWEIERVVRESSGVDPALDEERSFLLMYLREFAAPDGGLPLDFDDLVRETFGDLLASAQR